MISLVVMVAADVLNMIRGGVPLALITIPDPFPNPLCQFIPHNLNLYGSSSIARMSGTSGMARGFYKSQGVQL